MPTKKSDMSDINDYLDSPVHPVPNDSDGSSATVDLYVATRVLAALIIADERTGAARNDLVTTAADFAELLVWELHQRAKGRQAARNKAAEALPSTSQPDMPDA